MAKAFVTDANKTIDREHLVCYLNTGTDAEPVWSPIGKRVEDSSAEYDWQSETKKDILGATRSTAKKPIVKQTFEPVDLDSGDAAAVKIHDLAVVKQDAAAIAALDLMVGHYYLGEENKFFAERYPESMIEVHSFGGPGGGNITMPFEVTFGGERVTGSVSKASGTVTFTPDMSNVTYNG